MCYIGNTTMQSVRMRARIPEVKWNGLIGLAGESLCNIKVQMRTAIGSRAAAQSNCVATRHRLVNSNESSIEC